MHYIKVHKQTSDQFNLRLLGVYTFAMSKCIMNGVMYLACDIGIRFYYQDTDSMHLERHELTRLSDAFRERYGRELIYADM